MDLTEPLVRPWVPKNSAVFAGKEGFAGTGLLQARAGQTAKGLDYAQQPQVGAKHPAGRLDDKNRFNAYNFASSFAAS